jgi:hypothetical protein
MRNRFPKRAGRLGRDGRAIDERVQAGREHAMMRYVRRMRLT